MTSVCPKADIIYKIAPAPLWCRAEEARQFDGAPVDLADGYIHFSTAAQVRETAERHFKGKPDLLLIAIRTATLDPSALRWERSRGGDLFPHLYGPLLFDAVLWVKPLPLGPDGHPVFPDLA
ncbi:DUF952 domain-containing protein [Ancylobacter sp. 6x-1]|uniref:DUF952 domain-containing protein n=1 Tax=Ancylobacter crimeensis TaxID=2579147 RepID=A0ABT0D7W2_9HYPH|nr:DUF952 domain-containing protein [Ancylobacter crimeensis]MCK0196045.1 DUF952 domain-containing protein [Ancylobacter crimeensis]